MNIFVGDLSKQAMDSDLRNLFSKVGAVKTATVVTDAYTHRSRGFGHVEMEDQDNNEKAIRQLNGIKFMNQNIIVRMAELPKPPRKLKL